MKHKKVFADWFDYLADVVAKDSDPWQAKTGARSQLKGEQRRANSAINYLARRVSPTEWDAYQGSLNALRFYRGRIDFKRDAIRNLKKSHSEWVAGRLWVMRLLLKRGGERSQLKAIRTALEKKGYAFNEAAIGERIRSFLRKHPRQVERALLLYRHFEEFKVSQWKKRHPRQPMSLRADGLRLTAVDKNEEGMLAQLL
jgi:hypothetical protein